MLYCQKFSCICVYIHIYAGRGIYDCRLYDASRCMVRGQPNRVLAFLQSYDDL